MFPTSSSEASQPSGPFLTRDRTVGRVAVEVAFTDRRLDLAEPAAEQESGRLARELGDLAELAAACEVPLQRMHQVHGAVVASVASVDSPQPPPTADALVTTARGVGLLVRSADCVPVLLGDADHGVIAAVHCGRSGVLAGVVPEAVGRMRDLGAERVHAWIGPHVCGRCYEVPDQLREQVSEAVPAAWAETSWGTASLDLGAAVQSQLRAADVVWTALPVCTREDDRLWSYRGQGAAAGRLGSVIWMPA